MRPAIDLAALRRIGWHLWDPIGIADSCAESEHCADEYDEYLSRAWGKAANGATVEEIGLYLSTIEYQHMGLGDRLIPGSAIAAAEAIVALTARHSPPR